MKKFLLSLAAGAILSSSLLGQSTVTTEPVGFTTVNLKGSSLNLMGLNLVQPVVFQSLVTDVTGAAVTVGTTDFDTVLTDGTSYFAEITTGTQAGVNVQIESWTGAELTLAADLSAVAADVTNESIRIRQQWTLGDVFGTDNSAGLMAGTATSADLVILLLDGSFRQFFFSSGGLLGTGWREVGGGNTDRSGTALYHTNGIIVQTRDVADKSFKLLGSVLTGTQTIAIADGLNIVSNVFPVEGVTLGTSGLHDDVDSTRGVAAGTATNADLVIILGDDGSFSQYFFSSGGLLGTGWRAVGGGNTDRADTALPFSGSYLVVRRQGTPGTVDLLSNLP